MVPEVLAFTILLLILVSVMGIAERAHTGCCYGEQAVIPAQSTLTMAAAARCTPLANSQLYMLVLDAPCLEVDICRRVAVPSLLNVLRLDTAR